MNIKDKVIITITGVEGEVIEVTSTEVLIKHKATIDGQIKEVLQWYTYSVVKQIEEEIVVKRGILSEDKVIEFGIIPDDVIAEVPKKKKGKK